MDGQERAGLHTSTCWSPREKTWTYSQHADTEFLVYEQGHTCIQPNIVMGTHGTHIQILNPVCTAALRIHTHAERDPHVYQRGQSCSSTYPTSSTH